VKSERPRIWISILGPVGHTEIFGGIGQSDEAFWTRTDAQHHATKLAEKRGLGQIEWQMVDETLFIGRCSKIGDETSQWVAVLASIRLPQGKPPENLAL
jgi:hypothetical protein